MKNILKTTLFAGVAAMLAPLSFAADAAQPVAAQPQAEKSFFSADKFSASVSFAYESNYVFRGIREAQDSLQPEVEVAYALTDALGAYIGVFNNSPLDNNYTETDINLGMTYQVAAFTFDLGYTLYWNTSLSDLEKAFKFGTTNELKVGVSYDTSELLGDFAVTPSLYYYYDFDMECSTVELSLDYSAPISKWILGEGKDFLSLDTSIYYGYRNGSRFKAFNEVYHDSTGYSYVGINADLVLRVNEVCSLSFGVRWANVNAHSSAQTGARPFGGYSDTVWFGTSMCMGF